MTPAATFRTNGGPLITGIWLLAAIGCSLLATGIWMAAPVTACNEQVCASVVSKCMLTASCKCDLKNCSCCKECFNCLSYLYTECCSCVDMCPKPNATRNGLSSKSHVEDLEGIPGLFKALTDEEEIAWSTMTFPVDFDAALYGAKFDWGDMAVVSHGGSEQKLDTSALITNKVAPASSSATGNSILSVSVAANSSPISAGPGAGGHKIITYNCTVAFMSQCLSWNKCKDNCQSMGASSYRWFHDGCCECVGSTCLNYGVNESRCPGCPDRHGEDGGDGVGEERQQQQQPHEDELDYGHLNGPMDGADMHI